MRPKITTPEKFWSKVDKTSSPHGCWIWTGKGQPKGYAQVSINYRLRGVHRVAWEYTHGPIPDGLWVLHNCPGGDNPACVNPNHLFLGTHADNMADMVAKGRSTKGDRHYTRRQPKLVRRGEANNHAALTEQIVRDMRAAAANGTSYRELAQRYGVSWWTVRRAVVRQTWQHVV